MTTKQLMESVAALGFERTIEKSSLFFTSANRALSLIYTDREITRTVKLSLEPAEVESYVPKYRHVGKTTSFPLCGVAYSFASSGNGTCTIKDGYNEYKIDLHGNMSEHRGFLAAGGEIIFSGDYAFTVYHLSAFRTKASDNVSDIPIYDGRDSIDVSSKFGDFLSFTTMPTDESGNSVDGVSLDGGKIYFPKDVSAELSVRYRRAPVPITEDDLLQNIDIPRDCEPLLPLLTSAFMWLDDDADKAQYYMALYRDSLARIGATMTSKADRAYSTNGWA